MDRQYLESFTEDQLKHYLNTLKRRVLEMKNLTIALGQENLELAEEYKTIVERKKEAHFAVEKKNGWTNWIHKSKDKITNLLHLNKEEPSEFEPQFSKEPQRQVEEVPRESPQKKSKQREVEEPSEKKDINMNNFNFDDLYYISRDKFVDLVGKGGEQIKHIKQLLIEKVKAKESKAEKDQTVENEDEKREVGQHNYTQLAKEEDLTIKNVPAKLEEGPQSHQSDKTGEREYTPADL